MQVGILPTIDFYLARLPANDPILLDSAPRIEFELSVTISGFVSLSSMSGTLTCRDQYTRETRCLHQGECDQCLPSHLVITTPFGSK